jgi:hypothetical protein
MRASIMLSLLLLSGSCKDKGKDTDTKSSGGGAPAEVAANPSKDRKPTGTPRPQAKLAVTLDGKTVPMVTALAWKTWDGQIQITASSVPVGCDEVTGEMRRFHDGEVTFDVYLISALQKDGTQKPMLQQTWFAGGSEIQIRELVPSTGDGSPGQPTTAEVAFEQKSADRAAPKTIIVKGTLDAIGCPVAARKDLPALPPPMAGTIEIAGKKLPIRFAKLDTSRDWPSLDLYTGGEACKQVPFSPSSELHVALTWFDKAKPEVSQVQIGGSVLGDAVGQTFDKKKLKISPMPLAAGEIELAGDIVINEYPVKLDGKVTAVVCP